MATALKIFLCLMAVALGFPLWFPVLMSLFGITMGILGTAIGLFSALFALAIVGGVLTLVFALPALALLSALACLVFMRAKRPPASA
jgi:hypothetical protein